MGWPISDLTMWRLVESIKSLGRLCVSQASHAVLCPTNVEQFVSSFTGFGSGSEMATYRGRNFFVYCLIHWDRFLVSTTTEVGGGIEAVGITFPDLVLSWRDKRKVTVQSYFDLFSFRLPFCIFLFFFSGRGSATTFHFSVRSRSIHIAIKNRSVRKLSGEKEVHNVYVAP